MPTRIHAHGVRGSAHKATNRKQRLAPVFRHLSAVAWLVWGSAHAAGFAGGTAGNDGSATSNATSPDMSSTPSSSTSSTTTDSSSTGSSTDSGNLSARADRN